MNSKNKAYFYRRLQRVRPLHLSGALVAAGLTSVYLLRRNNLKMVELRQKLQEADKSGQDVDVALNDLQQYVLHHMNTSLATESVYPPIQLQYTYERLIQDAQSKADSANSQLYIKAKDYCERLDPNSILGRDRVPCVEQYLQDHHVVVPTSVRPDLYKFDFVAPRWSPDLAGWSLVLFGLLALVLVARLVSGWLVKQSIKKTKASSRP